MLKLYADGVEQPIIVAGPWGGAVDPEDALEFYARGVVTSWTQTRIYWLVEGSEAGARITLNDTDGGVGAADSFFSIEELKERTFYFSSLKNGDEENFFGAVVMPGVPADHLLTLPFPDFFTGEKALLEVALQGTSDVSHQVALLLNEVEVGEVVFEEREQGVAAVELDHSSLLEDDNLVSLEAEGGETDISLVDYVRITYKRTYTAEDDTLRCSAEGGELLTISGFSSPEIRVIDSTDPKEVFEEVGEVTPEGDEYSITVTVTGEGERTLFAFTEEQIKDPLDIIYNFPSTWHQESEGAEVVIISHEDFLASLTPLKEHREQQGWEVALVAADDLYDELNFGHKTPFAIRDFLNLAHTQWEVKPRFVLLVGDASFDPKNYLGYGEFDLLPTKLIDTEYNETASDDWFTDFDDDGLPEIVVGRLPVVSPEETSVVVNKIIDYEDASGFLDEAVLVADENVGYNFEAACQEVESLMPEGMTITDIFLGQLGSEAAREGLLDSLNEGPLLVNYAGHGSVEVWQGGLFDDEDARALTNYPELSFFINMTCLNGFFQAPYAESLAEVLLKSDLGGAIAVWTSSGLTYPQGQSVMNQELMRLLFNGEELTIGEATRRAKEAINDQDIRRTWILFGDPVTSIATDMVIETTSSSTTSSIKPTTPSTSSTTTSSIKSITSSTSSTTTSTNPATTTTNPATTTTNPATITTTTTTTRTLPCTAEALYGEDSKEVEFLRYTRDNILNRTSKGRELIKLYYQWSPVIVKIMEKDEALKKEVKEVIDRFLLSIEGDLE
jgi:hypothetical protein